MNLSKFIVGALFIACLFTTGCALVPYAPMLPEEEGTVFLPLRPGEAQIERGRPVALVDGMGHYLFSIPSKLLLLDTKIDNHDISAETEQLLQQYLADNNMVNVKVRLNQYAPGGEWRRLFQNKGVPAFWRYSIGILTLVQYTILPGRLFGGDHYNPYTNTINLYSDLGAVALHEAAHAKDFARRSRGFRGFYSILRILPPVTLYQEALASGDAIGYLRSQQRLADEKGAYPVLYPAYGSYMASAGLSLANPEIWVQYAILYGTAWTMKIIGYAKAATRDEATTVGGAGPALPKPADPRLGEPQPISE